MKISTFVALSVLVFLPDQLAEGCKCLFPPYLTGEFNDFMDYKFFDLSFDFNLLRLEKRFDNGDVKVVLHNLTSETTWTATVSKLSGNGPCESTPMPARIRDTIFLPTGMEDEVELRRLDEKTTVYTIPAKFGYGSRNYVVFNNWKKRDIEPICTPSIIDVGVALAYFSITAPSHPGIDVFTKNLVNCVDSPLG